MPSLRRVLIFGTLLSSVAYFAALPFLPLVLTARGATDPATVGLAIGAIALIAALGGGPVGAVIDRTSARPFLITGLVLTALAYLVLAAVTDLVLSIAMIITLGVGRTLMEPASKHLLSTIDFRTGSGFRWRHAMLSLGAIAGPAAGAVTFGLSEQVYFAVPALLYAGYAVMLILITRSQDPAAVRDFVAPPAAVPDRPREGRGQLTRIIMIGILIFTVFSQLSTVFPLLLNERLGTTGVTHLAVLLIINAVLNLAWQFVLPRLRLTVRASMIIGTFAFVVALALFQLGLETVPLLYLGILFWSAGQSALLPGQEIMLHQLTGTSKGLAFGLGELRYLGFFLGPWLGGALSGNAPAAYPAVMFGVCLAAALLLLVHPYGARPPRPAARASAVPGGDHQQDDDQQ
ncbi:MFS transporter [Microlunatus sp. GCM10028923]|uniref:MFS transporter n=1 Tax=Microlunatus sp. GCM10028923 TaxID=3273400 RepID=UPI0036097E95